MDELDDYCAELAHHYSSSGNPAKAIEYLERAARQAVQRGALEDAIGYARRGLALVDVLPDVGAREPAELALLLTLGPPLTMSRGYGVAEVAEIYTRIQELAERHGDLASLAPAMASLVRFRYVQGRIAHAQQIARELLAVTELRGDSGINAVIAHGWVGVSLLSGGHFHEALQHCERGRTLFAPLACAAGTFEIGFSPGVLCYSYAAWGVWIMGFPARAAWYNDEALRLAEMSAHANTIVWALGYSAWLHQMLGDVAVTREAAERGSALSREHGFPLWEGWIAIPLGWALAREGEVETGLVRSRWGAQVYLDTCGEWSSPYALGVQADIEWQAGRPAAGLELVERALATVARNGERWYEAELLRLRGELTLASTPEVEERAVQAEQSFQCALEVAVQQGAKSWELRAATSLARIWARTGRRRAAQTLLADCYAWFTEGFDSADLRAASALLDQLRAH